MNHALLACGPYFNEAGLVSSLVLLLLIKPLSYFAYVRAFRFRVCAAIPMKMSQAVGLTAIRAALGLVLVGGGAIAIASANLGLIASWVYLYLARIFAWWIVGRIARLRGWRMLGWIAGGEAINTLFDLSIVFGLGMGVAPAIAGVALIGTFIWFIEVRGGRPELLTRFSSNPCCQVCQYDLTGNLSGTCPECGTSIRLVAATV